jgi:hypothetical protein
MEERIGLFYDCFQAWQVFSFYSLNNGAKFIGFGIFWNAKG